MISTNSKSADFQQDPKSLKFPEFSNDIFQAAAFSKGSVCRECLQFFGFQFETYGDVPQGMKNQRGQSRKITQPVSTSSRSFSWEIPGGYQ